MEPVIQAGKIVELRPAPDERYSWCPVTVVARITSLRVIDYPGKYGSDLEAFLPALQELRHATFQHTGFDRHSSPHALQLLSKLPRLESLDIRHSSDVDLKAIEYLARSQSLIELDLSYCNPAFQFGPLVRGLPRLQVLRLAGTQIDDEQFEALAEHRSIRKIDIRKTPVTAKAVLAFREKHPHIDVEY